MKDKHRTKFVTKDIFKCSVIGAFTKLNPKYMMHNPVMFVVEIGFVIALLLSIFPELFGPTDGINNVRLYNIFVCVILFVTVLFANFAEAVAEGRGKAQAESLKKTQKDTKARLLKADGTETVVSSSELKKGDVVMVSAGEIIPNDGEVIEGTASVDESAITGESFLDKMIALVEGASRKKTPNEIALQILLVALTIIFMIVIVTLYPIGRYSGVTLPVSTLIALAVCLIPTTIGALLSAIGIAGMDRVTRFNVIAMSGKAVEACGDVDTMILDKTGTITYGNRMAADFIPVSGVSVEELTKYAALSSLSDATPEGKSVVALAKERGVVVDESSLKGAEFIEFTAKTRMSGVDLPDGISIRKGASDAIVEYVKGLGGAVPADLQGHTDQVSKQGGTPLTVCVGKRVLGVIYLKDIVKDGLVERFARLRAIGIKTIMCTGDNPLTAATIAQEAGVDGFIAECRPEDKIKVIKEEQAQGKIVAMTGDGTNDAPALAQADVGLAMNSGTTAAKEAANMVDLDSDPTKILEVVEIGKQLLITRGSLTTFSIANDIAKYFAIIPAMFMMVIPQMQVLNIMKLASPTSAILSALIFNAIIIPCLIPLAMRGVKYKPMSASKMLTRNMLIYGLGGVIVPFIGIKVIDLIIAPLLTMLGLGMAM
ncbi:potassium-transporting ATPase subunit KdpB [Flavonifractor plautii]|uniref:potassium-transporting ATPase subunit KdpB n=1 Tax=Flavonifractor plautii TaxID=292800 RepID=UPI00325C2112